MYTKLDIKHDWHANGATKVHVRCFNFHSKMHCCWSVKYNKLFCIYIYIQFKCI